jgi:spore coat polysaccharide biosynthesis protein SpsF
LTVDTPEDYNLICRVFELLYPTNPEFGLPSIAALFAHQPGLREINRHIRQKAVR